MFDPTIDVVRLVQLKGDGNYGEPDVLQKLELEKKAQNWL